jgi:cytochrome b pre-mRNA-processing protein 3
MYNKYINLYNKFILLTTNKDLYVLKRKKDNFSDRISIFLIHFALFLVIFKNEENKKKLQVIYDFLFKQIELSIREIGYGDQSINKKMKDYVNLFHNILSKLHFWNNSSYLTKKKLLSFFLSDFTNISYLVQYFDQYVLNLSKNSLKSYLKSVNKS